ncbi:ribonuclease 3-like protein 2 isoform X2 [Prunus avium]|uniref:Ribonuclease 3-like protein 2 isoform X2 n=1 Tax=Prunus avium TaxID=42229 RepID=A0A6P5S3Q1_PRUAV|nr:ribonuclease 3-like protein 2 isoform X2 [Prunus avium]
MNKMKKAFTTPTSLDRELEPSPVMKESVTAVEKIVGYSFKNKRLLEEALTHPSVPGSASYQRLEVLGDSVLNHAVTNYFFCMADRRKFNQDQITKLRSANAGNLKLARVAVRLGLYPYLRRYNTPVLDDKIFKPLLEPIYTLEDLRGRPMAILHDFCLKNGRRLEIKLKPRDETENISIAGVYVDDVLVGSGSSKGNSNARQNAAKEAVHKLSQSMVVNDGSFEGIPAGNDRSFRIEEAIQMLHVLCVKKRLLKRPDYKEENVLGPPHERKYLYSVKVVTSDGSLQSVKGDEKSRKKCAMNSAAYKMFLALQEYDNMINTIKFYRMTNRKEADRMINTKEADCKIKTKESDSMLGNIASLLYTLGAKAYRVIISLLYF